MSGDRHDQRGSAGLPSPETDPISALMADADWEGCRSPPLSAGANQAPLAALRFLQMCISGSAPPR
ncbi:MAG: hypothetical protein ACK55I_34440, partial [bacterium]